MQGFEGQEAAAGKGDVTFLPSGFFRDAITLFLQPDSAKTTCTSPGDCGVRDLSAADTPTQSLGSFFSCANSSSSELGHLPVQSPLQNATELLCLPPQSDAKN